MSCSSALSRQVAGAGAGWCRVPGAGAVSWLCAWWRQVAGAGARCRCWVAGAGCRSWCWEPAACAGCRVPVLGGVACICEGVYFRIFVPDSEAMGFLLQLTMSCLRALSTHVAGVGALSWLCTWWRRVTVPGAGCAWWRQGAGAGAVSWLCARWRQGAGCRCWVLAVRLVERIFMFPR